MAAYTIPGWLAGASPKPGGEGGGTLKVKKLSAEAKLPERATEGAAGYDLRSSEPVEVPAGGRAKVPTALAIGVPRGYYGRIAPRSGLAWRAGLAVGAGVVDPDYRGEIEVILFNHGQEAYQVAKGERCAQLIIERIALPEVEEVEALDSTERGGGGFGSTGRE